VHKISRYAIAVALLATTALAQSQMGISGRFAPGGSGFGRFGRDRLTITGHHGHRPSYPAYGYYGLPFSYSDYYEPYELEYPPPQPPPEPPAPAAQVKDEPLPDPVLLELHGSQWVRVTNFGESSERALAETPTVPPAPSKPLPPAILVYHDGHTEELSSYSIIGESIYTKTDYWSTGAWTRTIPIASLDVPATLRQNHERGIPFQLPSGPDEVMIRP
jgi:hypothetical protein